MAGKQVAARPDPGSVPVVEELRARPRLLAVHPFPKVPMRLTPSLLCAVALPVVLFGRAAGAGPPHSVLSPAGSFLRFGEVVALRGGVLLIGAPAYANGQGRVVVVRRDASSRRWVEQATLASADTSHMRFGQALAATDDRVFVGAPGPLPRFRQMWRPDAAARVFVFRDSAGIWVRETPLTSPGDSGAAGASGTSRFGAALLARRPELWVANPAAR